MQGGYSHHEDSRLKSMHTYVVGKYADAQYAANISEPCHTHLDTKNVNIDPRYFVCNLSAKLQTVCRQCTTMPSGIIVSSCI